jgi:uncharacterized protein YjiK
MTRPFALSSVLAAAAFLVACSPAPAGARSLFASEADRQWHLPDRLHEVSGLAVSPDGRLFAHDDEIATIYEVDFASGAIVKRFTVGAQPMTGDFEGLTITPDGDFWLTDSEGRLLRFREGGDNARVEFERFNTGVGDECEVEGIAYRASDQNLVLACKRPKGGSRASRDDAPVLRAWRLGESEARGWGPTSTALANAAGVRRFQPSGLEFDARSGRLIVISANDGAIAELDPEGALISAQPLGDRHRQTEGVAILADGSLILADEGGNDQALISRYQRLP